MAMSIPKSGYARFMKEGAMVCSLLIFKYTGIRIYRYFTYLNDIYMILSISKAWMKLLNAILKLVWSWLHRHAQHMGPMVYLFPNMRNDEMKRKNVFKV
jgi:hypothetical protein